MKIMLFTVALVLMITALAIGDKFLVVDYVPQESSCGGIILNTLQRYYRYCEVEYVTSFAGQQPPNTLVLVTGVWAYGQGQPLEEVELQAIRQYLASGGKVLIFGNRNIRDLPPESWLGWGEITRDPWQSDSLWGCQYSILEGLVFLYDESGLQPAYYIQEYNPPHSMDCLNAQYGMSGSPRGVQYEDPVNGSKSVTLNIDISLITEGRNSPEDLIVTIFRDYFGYQPTGIEENESLLPEEFVLYQNYPNPFNSSTVIEYQLPSLTYIKLEIYNLLGEKVATLVDDRQESGFKSVRWNASDYPSSVYFAKLSRSSTTSTLRLTLLR